MSSPAHQSGSDRIAEVARSLEADVLVISDFIAQNLPHALLERMNRRRAQQTRFHAVAMSRHAKAAILRVFDNSWLLDCGLRGRLLRRWQRS